MDICSPKDAFVLQIFIHKGDQVTAGTTPLLQLDTLCEDRDEARLLGMEQVRTIAASQYELPDADILLRLAKAAVDIAAARLTEAEHNLQLVTLGANRGTHTPADLQDATDRVDIARQEKARADAQSDQADASIKRHQKITKASKAFFDAEKTYIAARRKNAAIIAPITGTIEDLRVSVNSFAELGSVLLTIKPV